MCVVILLADTGQKEEGILSPSVHAPLSFDCVCKVISCLESLLPQFPCPGGLYPQTVNQNKPLLPQAASIRHLVTATRKTVQLCEGIQKLECSINKTLVFIYLTTQSHMFGNFLLCSQYCSRCESYSHDGDIDKREDRQGRWKVTVHLGFFILQILPIARSPELSILTQRHEPSKQDSHGERIPGYGVFCGTAILKLEPGNLHGSVRGWEQAEDCSFRHNSHRLNFSSNLCVAFMKKNKKRKPQTHMITQRVLISKTHRYKQDQNIYWSMSLRDILEGSKIFEGLQILTKEQVNDKVNG